MSKKVKGQKVNLNDFLGAAPSGGDDWADEHELPSSTVSSTTDNPRPRGDYDGGRGGPRGDSSRDYQPRSQVQIPSGPPYTAYIGNLAYDCTNDDLFGFFTEVGPCKVVTARMVIDKETGRSKGFGYVEYGDRESLENALKLSGYDMMDRRIRVDVAEPQNKTSGFGSRERPDYEDKTAGVSNWRREKPLDLPPPRPAFGNREGSNNNNNSSSGGAPRSGFGFSREPREGRDNFGSARSSSGPGVERKRLNLAPRTAPVESAPAAPAAAAPAAPAANKPTRASPFGAAKPIDTTKALAKAEEKLKKLDVAKEDAPAAPASPQSKPTDSPSKAPAEETEKSQE
ncbi:Eukaryotic translation initiation factor 4B [Sorochytrium milnesiophthora]